jgi:hypothetical protein
MVDVIVSGARPDESAGVSVTADMSELTVIVEVGVGVVFEATEITGSGVVCDDTCANTSPPTAALCVVALTAAFASAAAAELLTPIFWYTLSEFTDQ